MPGRALRIASAVCLLLLGAAIAARRSAPVFDPAAGPLAGVVAAIDPGHGGSDRGACHLPSGLIEKEINMDMAFRLKRGLEEAGAAVILTRRDDTFVPLDERAQIANRLGADVFLSLHVNRFPIPECFGAQTFHLPSSEAGRRLAMLIQEELLTVYPPNYRQALPGNYRVLRGTKMPAALIEIGFVTSPRDRQLMQTTEYRDRVAAAIVRGVERFFAGEAPGGSPDEPADEDDA
ncbi:MAG: N-acetylmuramoyl-L-alanine amidase [Firmicutes bacterium]|nr:N-acetylmuramoyl-L-alanine amidase [Bacillota bacterium]